MREIVYHETKYLRSNNLVMYVDEKQVHFINGIAAVKAFVRSTKDKKYEEIYSGIINEEYQEVFDDDIQYGDAHRNLMFLGYNTNICRCGENDFIVTVRQGDEYHTHYVEKHIRIENMKATLINEHIGQYTKTNDENILIIGSDYFNSHNKKLYNIAKGEYVCDGYDEISIIDGYSDRFAVKKRVTSLTKESPENENLYLTDNLYFQIDQNGHIISKIFSQRKLKFLDYGDNNIDEYPMYCKQELIEESQKLKEAVDYIKTLKK